MGQYKHLGGAWLEFSITHKDKEIPWKSLGEPCDSDGKEWGGFHSGKMILGGMVVGIRAWLLERRRKWENQKARTESRLCVQDETHTIKEQGRGLQGGQREVRRAGDWDSGATKAGPAQGGFAWDQIKTKKTALRRISLVVRGLRICPQCRGHGLSLLQEDFSSRGGIRLMHHNNKLALSCPRAAATEP